MPRGAALATGRILSSAGYYVNARLRRTAHINLRLAMPEISPVERSAIVRSTFQNMGRLLAEFSQFPRITPENIGRFVTYDGFEHYHRAAEQGCGVLFLTGHFGAWELCAFAHGAYGYPLNFLTRPLDNPLIDKLIASYRTLSGNRPIDKNNAVRPVMEALRRREAVGFLIDVNTLPESGVFCDFFGAAACSTTGLAVFALRTEAPVVPGFLIWDEKLKKHRLEFAPEVPLIRTGDFKQDVLLNTGRFTKIIEDWIRRYPDQWLWVHKRWNTRPDGEPDLYRSLSGPEEQTGIETKAPFLRTR
jgi:KDO2-lipid IV(A) lauroyltransferase